MASTAAPRGRSPPHLSAELLETLGNRLLLRSPKPQLGGDSTDSESHESSKTSDGRRPSQSDDDEGLRQLREKLLGHLHDAAERMKLVRAPLGAEKPPPPEPVVEAARPSRRAARKSPVATPPRGLPAAPPERTVRLRSEDTDKRPPPPSVSLSRDEIEEDIFGLTGSRPRRRPKKRPLSVQRRLDLLFPGLSLADITAKTYKVAD